MEKYMLDICIICNVIIYWIYFIWFIVFINCNKCWVREEGMIEICVKYNLNFLIMIEILENDWKLENRERCLGDFGFLFFKSFVFYVFC